MSGATLDLLRTAAKEGVPVMDAMRMAAGTIGLGDSKDSLGGTVYDQDALTLVARIPEIVAAYRRILNGETVVEPEPDLGYAENYLYMLSGEVPEPEHARALETYLNTVMDHGMNASTFAARVIISTRSDIVSAIVGAIGALKGPLHGGAPGPALDVVFEIGEKDRAEPYLREKIESGERLMGFGHRVYKVRDPPRRRTRLRSGEIIRNRRRHGPLRAGATRREDSRDVARRVQAGTQPADQRRVLHRAAATRRRPPDGTLHPHLRHRPDGGVGRPTAWSSGTWTGSSARSRATSAPKSEAGFRSKNGNRGKKTAPGKNQEPYPSEYFTGI